MFLNRVVRTTNDPCTPSTVLSLDAIFLDSKGSAMNNSPIQIDAGVVNHSVLVSIEEQR